MNFVGRFLAVWSKAVFYLCFAEVALDMMGVDTQKKTSWHVYACPSVLHISVGLKAPRLPVASVWALHFHKWYPFCLLMCVGKIWGMLQDTVIQSLSWLVHILLWIILLVTHPPRSTWCPGGTCWKSYLTLKVENVRCSGCCTHEAFQVSVVGKNGPGPNQEILGT